MPRARLLITEAAQRFAKSSEDRLTEIFASVLDQHQVFLQCFTRSMGCEMVAGRVFTQHALLTGRSSRPDMQVEGTGDDGHRRVLWCEHKTGTDLTEWQRESYPRELNDNVKTRTKRLVLVTRKPADVPFGWDAAHTWQDVAQVADQAGRVGGGLDWRDEAMKPTAEAQQRLLQEFLRYLENEEGVAVEAVRPEDLEWFQRAEAAESRLEALFMAGVESVDRPLSGKVEGSGGTWWQSFVASSADWHHGHDGASLCLELHAFPYWDPEKEDDGPACFGFGYELPLALHESLRHYEEETAAFSSAGITIYAEESVLLYCTIALAEIQRPETLKAQQQALTDFILRSLSAIVAARPPELLAVTKRS